MDLLHVAGGLDEALRGELAVVVPGAAVRDLAPGLLACTWDAAPPRRLAFARQCLPDAELLRASSVKAWAQAVVERLERAFGAREAPPWRLHVFALAGGEVSAGRATLIEAAVDAHLQRHRRAWRRARGAADVMWRADEVLVQLVLWSREEGALSLATAEARAARGELVDRFVAGAVEVPPDKRPPSRAYQKILEVELRLGCRIEPGERCVDLGASPGGWSFVALERGAAEVVAVDRSPLRADLMAHPSLRFMQGDAFRYTPSQPPVDWLLCDVIAAPLRTLELLDRWLGERLCRKLAVTLKLKGRDEDRHLSGARALLARHAAARPGAWWNLRHLDANHNEVTVYGTGWA